MQLQRPLATVTPTVDGDVLAVLARAEKAFTARQVHELMNRYSYSGVLKVLGRLASQGTVRSAKVGNLYTFELNRSHLAARAIIELAGMRTAFLQRLRESFEQWEIQPAYAALFGSAARNDMGLESDIDLFVVRPDTYATGGTDRDSDVWNQAVDRIQHDATAWTGNDTRLYQVGLEELRHGLVQNDPILQSIRDDGIAIHGRRTFWAEMMDGR